VPEKQAAGRGGMIWAKLRRPVRGGLALTQFRRWLPTESRPRRLARPLIRHAICFGRNRVRGCDTKRNVLVYMVYSDKLIEGSPKNSTSSVPVMPWGADDKTQKCADSVG
jgi:hypothetical protein